MYLLFKRILSTIILSLALMLAGMILLKFLPGIIDKGSLLILVPAFFILSMLIHTLNFLGLKRDPEERTLFTFGSIGVKFILSALIALLYFEAFKKTGLNNILLFFVLYLTFTVYLVLVVVKDLNARTIKRA